MALNINSVLLREVFSYNSGIFLVEVMLLFAVKIFIFINSGTFCDINILHFICSLMFPLSALPKLFPRGENHDSGAQRGARTHDPEIKSLVLYRLS